jgi:AcrR family transcriptional regulator
MSRVHRRKAPDFAVAESDGDQETDVQRVIMDAAERLFAEDGYKRVGLRMLTAAAGANVAAVNYYFGGKLGLLEAVFRRRAEPINAERKRRFAAYRAAIGDDRPEVAPILTAFIEPTLRAGHSSDVGPYYRLLMGRMSTNPDPAVRHVLFSIFEEVGLEFAELLRRALPDLTDDDFHWRLACVIGSMQYVLADNGRIQELSGPEFDLSDVDGALRYLIPFLARGLEAPPVDRVPAGSKRAIAAKPVAGRPRRKANRQR